MEFADFVAMVKEVELEDPVDDTGLSIPLDSYRNLICNSVWEMHQTTWKQLPAEEREVAMMATVAKLIIDNFVLWTRVKVAFAKDD